MFTFSVLEGSVIAFEPCPFCGGEPEWVEVPGNDFIMRCTRCHASTRKARMEPETAARDWTRGEIRDDHYSILSDKRIDVYLHRIKNVLFSGYWFDAFPPFDTGFLCSDAVIVTDDRLLSIEPYEEYLLYEELGDYNSAMYCKSIADVHDEIVFKRSIWQGENLTAIEFQCGTATAVVSACEEESCMAVTFR